MLPSPRSQPSRPAVHSGSSTASSAHERGEPVVAVLAGLVEGVLRDHVGDGEQEELGARVTLAGPGRPGGCAARARSTSRAKWAAPWWTCVLNRAMMNSPEFI